MYHPFLGRPAAVAHISGASRQTGISGVVSFFGTPDGTMIVAEITGLPSAAVSGNSGFLGFHIHEGSSCTGIGLSDTRGHYNPQGRPHPSHAGDLPPLLNAGGRAYLSVLTNRVRIPELIGRTVVIHSEPDDFRTQPAGNAGTKIACGVIRSTSPGTAK